MKAKLYYEERTCLKGSKIHRNILGYETSEQLDECVLEERKQHTEKYRLTFSPSFFSKDPDAIFENSIKETKRIRLIRNVSEVVYFYVPYDYACFLFWKIFFCFLQEYNLTFSENVDRKKQSWFTRYCALSKFIQTARSVILKTRLEKNLSVLRNNVLNRACDMQFQEDRICQEFKPAKSGSVGSQIGLKSLEWNWGVHFNSDMFQKNQFYSRLFYGISLSVKTSLDNLENKFVMIVLYFYGPWVHRTVKSSLRRPRWKKETR